MVFPFDDLDPESLREAINQFKDAVSKGESIKRVENSAEAAIAAIQDAVSASKAGDAAYVCTQILASAMKTLRAVRLLSENDFVAEALAACRTLLEHAFNLGYMRQDPQTLVPMYCFHGLGQLVSSVKKLTSGFPPEALQTLEQWRQLSKGAKAERKRGRANTWSGETVRRMSSACGMETLYEHYALVSDLVHGSSFAWFVPGGSLGPIHDIGSRGTISLVSTMAMMAITTEAMEWFDLQEDPLIRVRMGELYDAVRRSGLPLPNEENESEK